jgi:cytochrome c-type biogenesis protein CcmH/NrfG
LSPRPNSIVHAQLRGKVERVEGNVLVGWLVNPQQPGQAVAFDLEVNGQPAGRHDAATARGDLARAGIGDGRHGFRLRLPAGLLREGANGFRLVSLPEQVELLATLEHSRPPVSPAQDLPPGSPMPQPLVGPRILTVPGAQPTTSRPAGRHSAAVAETLARLGVHVGVHVGAHPGAAPAGSAGQAVAAALAAGDWAGAVAAAQVAPAADADLVLAQGVALLELGQAEAAERALRWFEAHDPWDHLALYRLGNALEAQQRHAEAAEMYGRCRALRPQDARYLLQCGRMTALAANGGMGVAPERPERLAEAMAMLRQAAEAMPRDGRPLRDLAQLLLQAGEAEAALAAIAEAERRQPDKPAFPLERARILTRLDRIEEALEAAGHAVALEPPTDGALLTLRVLERWVAARRSGPWHMAELPA